MGLRKYIRSLQKILKTGEVTNFVLGNSGADYDSVIGSLLYAFYLTTLYNITYLPLIDCPRQDLKLRFQITAVLDTLKIDLQELLYSEMVPNLFIEGNYSFVLYDHNFRPQISSKRVTEIIDHHAFDQTKIKCPHVIIHCGSALTLLHYLYCPEALHKFEGSELHKIFNTYKQTQISTKVPNIQDKDLVYHLLLNGILIDTYGLNPNQSQVWTPYDSYAVQNLRNQIQPIFTFDQLAQSKFDQKRNLQLSLSQQRFKDYKLICYGNFSIHYSTILLNVDTFIKHYFSQIQEQIPIQNILDNELVAFMFAFADSEEHLITGNFRKFIILSGSNIELIEKIQKLMESLKFQKLENVGVWRKWCDPSGKISRKIFDKELKAKL